MPGKSGGYPRFLQLTGATATTAATAKTRQPQERGDRGVCISGGAATRGGGALGDRRGTKGSRRRGDECMKHEPWHRAVTEYTCLPCRPVRLLLLTRGLDGTSASKLDHTTPDGMNWLKMAGTPLRTPLQSTGIQRVPSYTRYYCENCFHKHHTHGATLENGELSRERASAVLNVIPPRPRCLLARLLGCHKPRARQLCLVSTRRDLDSAAAVSARLQQQAAASL